MTEREGKFVGRGGLKLQGALDHFDIDVSGRLIADLGCNIGGFTDCLLSRGAARVFAVDTGYGMLDNSLRSEPRVVVMERTNALYLRSLPEAPDGVVVDVAWTRQELIVPAALRLLAAGGWVLSLVKPHYEADRRDLRKGVLPREMADEVLKGVVKSLEAMGVRVVGSVESPIRGGSGNREFFIKIIKPATRE